MSPEPRRPDRAPTEGTPSPDAPTPHTGPGSGPEAVPRTASEPEGPAGGAPESGADSAGGPPSTAPADAAELPRLLDAMIAIGTAPELHSTLDRIAETAAHLADCRYALIGALPAAGRTEAGLKDFAAYGMDTAERAHRVLVDAVAEPERPRTRGVLELPIRVGEELFGYLHLAGKRGGGDFSDQDLQTMRVLMTEAGIAIDNALLHEAARQRERWIDGSVAVTTALLAGEGESQDALTVVAEQARRLAEAAAVVVLLPTGEEGLRVVAASVPDGPPETEAAGADSPEPDRATDRPRDEAERDGRDQELAPDPLRNLVGTELRVSSAMVEPLRSGEPLFADDAASDPRMDARVGSRFGPAMLLPLRSSGRVIGLLAVLRPSGAPVFTAEERTLAAQFAAQAALALVLADAQRDRERLAVYEDRDRIARDLHDLVIQRLFATGVMLESSQRKSVTPEVRELLGRAVEELDATIQEIRTAIFALQQKPTELPSGLRTRVLREIGSAAVPLGFQPSVNFVGAVDARVGELVTKNLVAALREALSNAYRHARASRVEVVVDATAALPDGRDAVRLTVADDGVGIPEEGRRSGLRNLSRRAEALGGWASWGPGLGEDGGGTTVTWEVPL